MKILITAIMLMSSIVWTSGNLQAEVLQEELYLLKANRNAPENELIIPLKALRQIVREKSSEPGSLQIKIMKRRDGTLNIKFQRPTNKAAEDLNIEE